jgi:hypothetical protein
MKVGIPSSNLSRPTNLARPSVHYLHYISRGFDSLFKFYGSHGGLIVASYLCNCAEITSRERGSGSIILGDTILAANTCLGV